MKISISEAKKICKLYNLGKFQELKPMTGGLVNHNFNLKTSQGRFVIRVLSDKFDKGKEERVKLEFKVLGFLKKNNFPYKVPEPLANNKSGYISSMNGKTFWVYSRLEGKSISKIEEVKTNIIKELANVLAIYHKTIKNLKVKPDNPRRRINWICGRLDYIEKIKPGNKVDRITLDNVGYFRSILREAIEKISTKNILVNHMDFDASNALFKNGKIVSIIDFDNTEVSSRVNDIATSIKDSCFTDHKFDKKKAALFLNTYENVNRLSKKEKEIIPYCILEKYCEVFSWYYRG